MPDELFEHEQNDKDGRPKGDKTQVGQPIPPPPFVPLVFPPPPPPLVVTPFTVL